MRLYFIRHGQSANNKLWDVSGSSKGRSEDPELTDNGHEQARLLADFIIKHDRNSQSDGVEKEFYRDSYHFTHLYTSLMVRAVRTGMYLSDTLGIQLQAWPEIHECGGIFLEDEGSLIAQGQPGKARSYFEREFPSLLLPDGISETGWWNRPFEANEDRPKRAQEVINQLLQRHGNTDDNVAIVSHGAFYNMFVKTLFQLSDQTAWYFMNNTAVSRFDFWGENGITLVYHNRTDHLPIHMVT